MSGAKQMTTLVKNPTTKTSLELADGLDRACDMGLGRQIVVDVEVARQIAGRLRHIDALTAERDEALKPGLFEKPGDKNYGAWKAAAKREHDALLRAESAEAQLREAREAALEEAAKVVEGWSTAANYIPADSAKLPQWLADRDFKIAAEIRARLNQKATPSV